MAEPSAHRRMKRALKRRLRRYAPRFSDHPDWSIGVFSGPTPSDLRPLSGAAIPAIDRKHVGRRADFVADPFGFRTEGLWHLFYEVMDLRFDRGHIEHSVSSDLYRWEHRGVVLREPFHLSYPQVFEVDGERYMVPEAWESGAVRLYRAEPFPIRWRHVADLITGPVLLDPTLFRSGGSWWMFVETSADTVAGELRLYMSPALTGPWVEHCASPIVRDDPRLSRPAGPVARVDGSLLRFAQDCSARYGGAVRAIRIDRLDASGYAETPLDGPLLTGSGAGWNAHAMHQLDLHAHDDAGWIAFVDGHGTR